MRKVEIMRIRNIAALGAVAATAGLAALPAGASAACHTVQEPWLYSSVTVCATVTPAGGASYTASAGFGCTVGGRPVCAPLVADISVGKTGYDNGVWVDGRLLPLK